MITLSKIVASPDAPTVEPTPVTVPKEAPSPNRDPSEPRRASPFKRPEGEPEKCPNVKPGESFPACELDLKELAMPRA